MGPDLSSGFDVSEQDPLGMRALQHLSGLRISNFDEATVHKPFVAC